jgi:hypothetical protein
LTFAFTSGVSQNGGRRCNRWIAVFYGRCIETLARPYHGRSAIVDEHRAGGRHSGIAAAGIEVRHVAQVPAARGFVETEYVSTTFARR